MKKQLFLFLCTLLSMLAGVQKVQAYTVENLVEDGWTLVNSESVTGVADNFYVLVDAYSSAYVMSAQADHFRPCYKTINSPLENPSFVWSLEGSDNSFKLKSAATGAYIKQASGWNTSVGYPRDGRGVATCTFTLNGGKYDLKCIESNAMVGHWNDGTSGVAEDGENIAANKSTAAADGFFLYAKPKADYIAALAAARQTAVAEASQTNPVEVTSWIQNADFSNDWGGWECTLSSSGNMQWGQKTLESWNAGNVVVKQVLSGVPDGLYRLSVDLISGNNDNKTAYVFAIGAGEVKSDPVSAVASAGNYNTMSAEVAGNTLAANNIVVTNGVLTVGFNQPSGWIVADNFKLYYMGEDMSIYVEAYHNALTTAQGVDQSAPMNGEVLVALQQALSDYATVDETSKAALQEATGALGTAASDATNSIAAYAKAAEVLPAMQALTEATNVYTAAAYAAYYSEPKAKFDARTLTNEEANTLEDPSVITGWRASNRVDDLLMSAYDEEPMQWGSYHINTWSTEGGSDGSGFVVPFLEYWTGDGDKLANKIIHAQMTGLERGTYDVTAQVRLRLTSGQTAPVSGLSLKVNEGEASAVSGTPNYGDFYVANVLASGIVKSDGVLDINFIVADANSSWASVKNVKFTRTGDIDPTEYRAAVAAKLEVAQGLVNEVMNADVDADLNAKIAATAGYEESTDIDALEQMANDLDVAIAAAQTSVANYQEAAAIINAASILDEAGQAVYNSNNKVLEVKAAYDAKTLVAVTDEQKADCRAALATAARAQTTYGADWSPVIANNDFEGNYVSQYQPKSDRDIYQPEGWTVVWENGDENDMTSLNSTCTSWNQFENMPQPENGGKNVYWARYRWGSTSSLTLKQTINLPAGSYELGAEGCLTNATDGNATLSVKFGDEVAQIDFTDAAWTKKTVNFSINEAQDVEILYNFTESKVVEIKAGVDNFTLKALYDAAWQAQIAAAQALAADDDAVAVGKLRDAIEDAIIIIVPTDEEKAALQAAVDQFNLDNADQESDQTAKVATNGWKKFDGSAAGVCATQFAPAIDTYDGRKNVNLAESYEEGTAEGTAVTRLGTIIYQDITGLKNGSYKVGFYGNAFFTEGRAGMTSPMADGATDVAYVFANDQQAFITAHIATSTTENNFKEFNVEVTDGTIRLGMGKEKAGTNWHTMQIYQLTWFTSAKALYALDKTDMEAAILLAGTLYEDPYKTNGKEALQQAIAEANAARISNHLNIAEFEAEIAKLNDAIKAYKEANYVALSGTYYVKNAAGKFMAAGHNWGTRGIVNETGLDLTLTPNNENKVAIDSRVYNGNNHFLGSNLYMDSGSFAWVIEQVGAEEYSIGNGAQYIGVDAEDNLALVNEPFAWQFLDAATVDATRLADGLAAMAAATADNGVDATFLLKDANFNRNDHRWEAWTVEFVSGDNKNLGGGCDGGNGNGNAESFHSAFNIYQTIANAPAGVYKMTAQGFYRQDDAVEEAAPVFYIGDVTAEVPVKTGSEGSMTDASYSFTEGLYTIDPIEFTLDADGDLTVGIKNGENVHQWVIFDNFRLTYYGPAAPKTDYTDYIINADLSDSESTAWNLAGTKGYHNSGNAVTCGNNAVFDFCQVVQNLPAGQYKLTAKSAYRYSGSEADEYAAIEAGTETKFASLYAKVGTKTFSSLVQNRWDGASDVDYAAGSGSVVVNEKFVPNSTAAVKAWFNADKYVNEVVFNLTADGDVTIGIAKDAQPAAGDFTVIGGWTLTRLGDAQPEYAITVAPAENGNVVADKATAAAGETVKVTATPDEGYMVDYGYYVYNETQYDFESIDMEHNIATFTMPAGPVSVVLAFKQAKVAYQFVPSEWGAGDAGRISPENVVADDAAGTITVNKSGANNVCLLFRSAKTYEVKAEQRYFVIKATGLSTAEAASYLWWLNNTNDGSQIAPTSIFEENGQTVFAWDCVTIPIGGKLGIEDTEFTDQGGWSTTFGMTLSDDAVPAVISYIGFQETIPEPVEEEAYEFVPSEWGAGDPGRISPENVVADDDMGTITVTQTGDNNVALLFKTNKLYYVENVDYFVIKAKGVSTEAGASYLWWLNGKNDNGAQFAPTSTATETDGTIILEWKISECGNIGENINPAGKSYLVGGDGWNTTFGLTQADALTPVVISYIGYGTKSATDISALKSQDAEGALKDGKYLIKGEIIVVKNGKLYKANGQLK
ncbi:MAG: hypothetical protein IKP30_04475 [Bacteroidaceae bacterium]|nr:hypothetical protein [Bacteroidaceae bacterium]